jgi:hypothetical protein
MEVTVLTYGSAGLGADLTRVAWPLLDQRFNCDLGAVSKFMPKCPQAGTGEQGNPCRLPSRFPSHNPLDLLMVGQGNRISPYWFPWIEQCRTESAKSKMVFEFWKPTDALSEDGPVSKFWFTRWKKASYTSRCKFLCVADLGGTVNQEWLVVARLHDESRDWKAWCWPDLPHPTHRPMANCLRPCGIPRKEFLARTHSLPHDAVVPFEDQDLMPAHAGSYIRTKKGIRRLLHDELAKGLGVPSTWLDKQYPDGRLMEQSIGVHIFEYLTPALQEKPIQNHELTGMDEMDGPTPALPKLNNFWKNAEDNLPVTDF